MHSFKIQSEEYTTETVSIVSWWQPLKMHAQTCHVASLSGFWFSTHVPVLCNHLHKCYPHVRATTHLPRARYGVYP